MEETGWKLVHGDVFRPPKHTKLLASLVGAGIQIFSMSLITVCKCLDKWLLTNVCSCGSVNMFNFVP